MLKVYDTAGSQAAGAPERTPAVSFMGLEGESTVDGQELYKSMDGNTLVERPPEGMYVSTSLPPFLPYFLPPFLHSSLLYFFPSLYSYFLHSFVYSVPQPMLPGWLLHLACLMLPHVSDTFGHLD